MDQDPVKLTTIRGVVTELYGANLSTVDGRVVIRTTNYGLDRATVDMVVPSEVMNEIRIGDRLALTVAKDSA